MTSVPTTLDLSRKHIEDMCEDWVQKNLNVLGVQNAADALRLLTERYRRPDRTAEGTLAISLSIFALRTFAMVLRELTQKQCVCVFHTPRGNGGLKHIRSEGRIFFSGNDYRKEEYLLDYYVCPVDNTLCPLLTMESEAKADLESLAFKDLNKLLSVSSPRRIYFGQVRNTSLRDAELVISSRLSSAYQSQLVARGDQISIILNVIGGEQPGFKFYSFDIGKRLSSERYIQTVADLALDSNNS